MDILVVLAILLGIGIFAAFGYVIFRAAKAFESFVNWIAGN
jgi:hypothetical protein